MCVGVGRYSDDELEIAGVIEIERHLGAFLKHRVDCSLLQREIILQILLKLHPFFNFSFYCPVKDRSNNLLHALSYGRVSGMIFSFAISNLKNTDKQHTINKERRVMPLEEKVLN